MKKILVLFLAVLLLLSLCACVGNKPEQAPSTSQDPEQVTSTSQNVTEDQNGNIVFSVNEIKKLEARQENYSRYYGEFVGEFIPSDDYGTVMPYIGRFASGMEGNYCHKEDRVGFCTLDGEIICDPVYEFCGALSTENYVYYLVRPTGLNEAYIEDKYLDLYDSPFLLIRDDGRNVLEYYGYIEAKGNVIRILTPAKEGNKRVSEYYNEDLQKDMSLSYEDSKEEGPYEIYCPGCKKTVSVDYPSNDLRWKKGESSFIGYVHNDCEGVTSMISADGELLCTVPASYTSAMYGVDEDYVMGMYMESEEYDPTKIKGFIYERETEKMHVLDGVSTYMRVGDTEFRMFGYDYESNEDISFIYDISCGSITKCEYLIAFGNGISYCKNGMCYVKDTDLNEIMSIGIHMD